MSLSWACSRIYVDVFLNICSLALLDSNRLKCWKKNIWLAVFFSMPRWNKVLSTFSKKNVIFSFLVPLAPEFEPSSKEWQVEMPQPGMSDPRERYCLTVWKWYTKGTTLYWTVRIFYHFYCPSPVYLNRLSESKFCHYHVQRTLNSNYCTIQITVITIC